LSGVAIDTVNHELTSSYTDEMPRVDAK